MAKVWDDIWRTWRRTTERQHIERNCRAVRNDDGTLHCEIYFTVWHFHSDDGTYGSDYKEYSTFEEAKKDYPKAYRVGWHCWCMDELPLSEWNEVKSMPAFKKCCNVMKSKRRTRSNED